MILLSYDVETTGLDKQKDRIIEVGFALYSTGQQKVLESAGYFVKSEEPISNEVTELTGITQVAVDRFGHDPEDAIDEFNWFAEQADAVIAHNGIRFDLPITQNAAKRLGKNLEEKLWIDTMTDIPGVKGEQLITMCAKGGILLSGAHSALVDAVGVLGVAQYHSRFEGRSFEMMVERAKSPLVAIQSHQARNNNADAKKFQFRWHPDFKIWWKAVKEMDIEGLANQVPFEMSRLGKEYPLEMLQDS